MYLTSAEISAAESLGSSAEAWSQVRVSEDFTPFQLLQSHLEGRVEIGSGARVPAGAMIYTGEEV